MKSITTTHTALSNRTLTTKGTVSTFLHTTLLLKVLPSLISNDVPFALAHVQMTELSSKMADLSLGIYHKPCYSTVI